MFKILRGLLAGCALAALCGCGDSVPLGQVRGTLTLDGRPVSNVVVVFVPDSSGEHASIRSAGQCDDQGKFTLRCDTGVAGGVVGSHRVIVEDLSLANAPRAPDGTITQFPRKRFPEKYSDPLQTPLRATIRAGEQDIALKMSST